MIEIEDAICAALAADTQLVAIIGALAISSSWPALEARYADVPVGVNDFASLSATDIEVPRARIAVLDVSPTENINIRVHDDDYQVSGFSRDRRLLAAVAWRVRETLNDKLLTLPSRMNFREMFCTFGSPMYEDDTRLFHQPMSVRVRWIG
ncbi:MAG TPA: hypothetical protein VK504_11030 [Vicinamibacterales bacterium]|nr:hypothetical protein [Vicinamibacterales bacterium]